MKPKPLYESLASLLLAIDNCRCSGNSEWLDRHSERLERLVSDHLPSGSGWDSGTTLSETSRPDRLVLDGSWHHMNDDGYYDGWTDHSIIVTPSLAFGINIRVTGRDRNGIKDYLAEMFEYDLTRELPAGIINS